MLLIQPGDRPTATDALNHGWLAGLENDNEHTGDSEDGISLIRNEGIPSRKRKNRLPPHGTPKKRRTERDLSAQEWGNTRCIPGDVGSEHAMLINDSRPLTEPTDLSSLADPSDIFNPNLHTPHAMLVNDSHPPAIEATDLPPWADPFDLFNFDLATPYSMHIDDFPASTNELISQFPVTSMESMPTNATPADPPQSHRQFSVPPPIPFSLPSTTTPPAPPPRRPPCRHLQSAPHFHPRLLLPLPPLPQNSATNPAPRKPSPASLKTALPLRRPKTLEQPTTTITRTPNTASAAATKGALGALATRREKTATVTRLRSILSIT